MTKKVQVNNWLERRQDGGVFTCMAGGFGDNKITAIFCHDCQSYVISQPSGSNSVRFTDRLAAVLFSNDNDGIMKKYLLALGLMMAVPFSAHASQAVGIFFGSPMSGIQYKHDDLRFSLGIDDFGLAFDKTFNLGSLTQDPGLNSLYTFVGAQYVDNKYNKLGVRGGIGFQVPVNSFEFYGEVGPTLYVVEDVDLDLEGQLGFRIRF